MRVNAGGANNGLDDDGNGYVDDVVGWTSSGRATRTRCPTPTLATCTGTPRLGDDRREGNNGIGVIGVAWRAKIAAVRGLDNYGYGLDAARRRRRHAADNGADVINASWGGPGSSQVLDDAVDYAVSLGVVFVAAAGNSSADARTFHPASNARAITFAASDSADARLLSELRSQDRRGRSRRRRPVAARRRDFDGYPGRDAVRAPSAHEHGRAAARDFGRACPSGHPGFTTEQVRQVLGFGRGCRARRMGHQLRLRAYQRRPGGDDRQPAGSGDPGTAGRRALTAPVSVSGHAGGSGFVRYELAYGAGRRPRPGRRSRSPRARWTARWARSTPRLLGRHLHASSRRSTGRTAYADRRQVVVDYVRITKAGPRHAGAHAMVKSGVTVSLEGTALGPSFLGFRVEWAAGINPPSGWPGIVLVETERRRWPSGPIATWDTKPS